MPHHDGVPWSGEPQQALHPRTGAGFLDVGDHVGVDMICLDAGRS